CDDSDDDPGFAVHDGWAVLAQSQQIVDQVADATADGTLADDATYRKWTEELGAAGVGNAHPSPAGGKLLAQGTGGFFDLPVVYAAGGEDHAVQEAEPSSMPSSLSTSSRTYVKELHRESPVEDALADFKGGSATLRFTGDGIELAVAADGSAPELT